MSLKQLLPIAGLVVALLLLALSVLLYLQTGESLGTKAFLTAAVVLIIILITYFLASTNKPDL